VSGRGGKGQKRLETSQRRGEGETPTGTPKREKKKKGGHLGETGSLGGRVGDKDQKGRKVRGTKATEGPLAHEKTHKGKVHLLVIARRGPCPGGEQAGLGST